MRRRRSENLGRPADPKIAEFARKLRDTPGRWVLFRVCQDANTASATARNIRIGSYISLPPERYTAIRGGPGKASVFVMYLGENPS